ncbi:MAG: hypothetical protein COW73_09130 [Nitrospirae bacterium CG18_big_fil_WC_8_21_14_2_50_70_55]|nr:hypothetical protein [Deltaproteobacteria bacterium]OIP62395.1 MAG: hypothetical protein AUK30_10400 [Nitrospirae bacterium CG2_30_70_394]PIQ04256.1 MAG: hypothetical protein COW73_09130 [Nitrospirae bacterium CG18_big_fil_WC_8_21_14_2_50_70_55]PIU78790.1 MAG: hypothetical protein COS73_06060 [Nitrospirae bacterium CG06_land_8_20_14_3_00_70_43]PIW81828.1 MAG: hypothetical protein COZ96_12070 [Nitrospirae bacterium CG_4_8_14_3_um_filter_70_85]PIX83114.1 MAG: hypothetical protein COZ33_07200 
MAELTGVANNGGGAVLALIPEGRHDGADQRIVLYRLVFTGGGVAELRYRAGAELREIARLARGLRRLAREPQPFAGLTLGWAITVGGEVAASGRRVTVWHEAREGGALDGYGLLVEPDAIEAFVDALEHEITALP